MADLIFIAVSLALAAYYVVRIFKFIPARDAAAADHEDRGDYGDKSALR